MKEIYTILDSSLFSQFYSLDIFLNTPLDILIQKKNTTLIMKYFKLLFEFVKKYEIDFHQKIRFFTYSFKDNYGLPDLLCDILLLIGDDLSVMNELFDFANFPLDSAIYDNSLVFSELQEPIFVESNSIYNDKDYILEKLEEFARNGKFKIQEHKSMIKAKINCLPGLCNMNKPKTIEFYTILSDLNPENEFFANKSLTKLVRFIWYRQIYPYYKIEMILFFIFFVLFNLNFAFLRELKVYTDENTYTLVTQVINIILFSYGIYCAANELKQLSINKYYFKSIWNYFDIALIPLLISSSVLDFGENYFQYDNAGRYVQLISSICMFCFWFRFLSFFRGFEETSSMIRLILNVISGVRYFVLFMVLFMLTLTTSLYVLHTEEKGKTVPSLWSTFLAFYDSALGDTSNITNYDLVIPKLNDFFMIISTFLFAIISLNLLVSIIGDKHTENKEAEAKTRIFEMINIIVDTHCSLTTLIAKKFWPGRKVGNLLVWIFNEKHEEIEEVKLEDLFEKKFLDLTNEFNELKKLAIEKKQE